MVSESQLRLFGYFLESRALIFLIGWNGCKTLAQIFRGAGFAAGLDPQQNAGK